MVDFPPPGQLPDAIAVRGARHNNLRDIDVDVPLWRTVAVVGVSGSGKTSLAMGTLYAEGLQRLLTGLSTYSRRRLAQAPLYGPPVQRQVTLTSGRTGRTVQLTVNYDNAVSAVERSLHSDDARTRQLTERFTHTSVCSVCGGTRLRPEALASVLGGLNLAEVSALDLAALREFASALPSGLPGTITRMTDGLLSELEGRLSPLLDVGLGYLTLDRAGASLSTGERQRIELTSTVRASTTGMLYVLDEPSVGLHPSNVASLRRTIEALVGNGNSVVIVEHERELIQTADWVIELGPGAGIGGGELIAQGRPIDLEQNPRSVIGPYLAGSVPVSRRHRPTEDDAVQVEIEIGELFNLRGVRATFPMHRLTGVAGPSGAGKTALVLDSLVPALRATSRSITSRPRVASSGRCDRCKRSGSGTSASGSRRRRCRGANRRGCGSPPGCAAASAARCTSSTSRPPGCTRAMSPH